jgi:anti-repressor protein
MDDLILIDKMKNLFVNARELHRLLGIGKDFSSWIKDVNEQCYFTEGKDYWKHEEFCSPISVSKKDNRGGHNRIEYLLTIEAAKMIIASRRTPEGREILRKLIQADENVHQQRMNEQRKQDELYQQQITDYRYQIKCKDKEIDQKDRQLSDYSQEIEDLTGTNDTVDIRGCAAILAIPKFGPRKMTAQLQKDGYIDKDKRPYRKHIENGRLCEKYTYVPNIKSAKTQLRITAKGTKHFIKKYGKSNNENGTNDINE